ISLADFLRTCRLARELPGLPMCGRLSPPSMGTLGHAQYASGGGHDYDARSAPEPGPPGVGADAGRLRGVPHPRGHVGATALVSDLGACGSSSYYDIDIRFK